jgi:hypothetical protein
MAEKQTNKAERVEIGFGGGQVVATRLELKQISDFRKAVEKGNGWHDLHTEDGDLAIDLSQVVFVRVAAPEHRIGFSQGG